jgi:DNA-binding transcriptional LysR family regulator
LALSIRNLEILKLVYELGSMRVAAERLYLSESAVSLQVKSLETHFGAPLFQREGRRLVPTEAGDLAYRTAVTILGLLGDTATAIQDLSHARRGRIEIAGSLTVGSYLLPQFLTAFQQRFPGVRIVQHVYLADEMFRRLIAGEFAFGVTPEHDLPPPLVSRRLREERVVIVAAPGYPVDRLTPEQLALAPFVDAPTSSRGRQNFDRIFREIGVPSRRVVFESGHPEGEKRAAMAGLGLLATFRFALETEIKAGLLKEVEVEGIRLSCPIALVHRPHKHFSTVERRLIEFLSSESA